MSARIYPAPPPLRPFPLRLVLTLIAGIPPQPHELEPARALLEHMTGGPVSASQLNGAFVQCRAFLRHARPDLAARAPVDITNREAFEAWCGQLSRTVGPQVLIGPCG